MLDLTDILAMWKVDCVIDKNHIDDASLEAIRCHAKYLEFLGIVKGLRHKKEQQQHILLRDKWLYYSGKMTQPEMDERHWPYDPFKGARVMKSDYPKYFEADTELQASEEAIAKLKTTQETLEEIVGTLRWRSQHLKNIIDWRKFEAGV